MTIVVTGSRDWTDRAHVEAVLARITRDEPGPHALIHGAARGLDTIAASIATEWGWKVVAVLAWWNAHGKAAGHRRNAAMLAMEPDLVVGFPLPDSRGTWDCLQQAVRAGIPIYVYTGIVR